MATNRGIIRITKTRPAVKPNAIERSRLRKTIAPMTAMACSPTHKAHKSESYDPIELNAGSNNKPIEVTVKIKHVSKTLKLNISLSERLSGWVFSFIVHIFISVAKPIRVDYALH